jgi:hypothetical protein
MDKTMPDSEGFTKLYCQKESKELAKLSILQKRRKTNNPKQIS